MTENPQPDPSPRQTARNRYEGLLSSRDRYTRVAEKCAALTIPVLSPPLGGTSQQDLPTPYQSVGASGVVNLASKLVTALLPPNTPFFRLAIDSFELSKIESDPKLKAQLDAALGEIERAVLVEMETSAARVTAFEAFLHLVATGNGLIEVPDSGDLKFYPLRNYVVQRDPMGHPMVIVLKECISPSALPEDVRASLAKEQKTPEKILELYTAAERQLDGSWVQWQEVSGVELPGSRVEYPEDRRPFIPLRWYKIDGEDYGRGLVEQYLGDLTSLESLTQALVEGSLAAAKVIFLVSPNAIGTSPKRLAEARSGDFVPGRPEDVQALQLQKFADFRTAKDQADVIERRLQQAFLLFSGVQRQGERVTAEEIRTLVQELEGALGGVYAVQAQDFQLPLAQALMARMARQRRLPKLPKKIVRPSVTTGLEALGRGNDLQKLNAFIATVAQALGPQVVSQYINVEDYLTRAATALGLSTKGLVKSPEEIQQMQQQAQQQSLVERLGPQAISAASRLIPQGGAAAAAPQQ